MAKNKKTEKKENYKTKVILNQAVADLSQFAIIIHQHHWYIRGSLFFDLHPKLDEWLDEIDEILDEVAERLITIGGEPYATLNEFSENTKLEEQKGSFKLSIDERIGQLVSGYHYLSELFRAGILAGEKDDDPVSVDLFTSSTAAVEKKIWFLQAFLQQEPNL